MTRIEIKKDIFIESWQEHHISGLIKNGNSKGITQYLSNNFPYPYTKEAAVEWIDFNKRMTTDLNFAITRKQQCIGGIGIITRGDIYCKTIEIGYWLGKTYQNKGIATKVIDKFIKYCFSNFDINRIEARVFSNNLASERVLLNNGFTDEAVLKDAVYKNGQYFDLKIFRILK